MAEFEPLRTIIVHDFTSPDREIVAHPDGARELVRCKNCKHYMQTSCPMTGTWATDEDYCSFGERRAR